MDLTDEIGVLALNSLYYDGERDKSIKHEPGGPELVWLEEQLSEESTRKFVIIMHVYPGARYKNFALWSNHSNSRYFELLRKYKDRVIIELAGHDHFTAMRYHSSSGVLDLPDPEPAFNFHNLLIAPSITPWYGNNPGISAFEISDSLVP